MMDYLDPASLSLNEYQQLSASTGIDALNDNPIVPLLGLAGEIGALIAEYKKKIRSGRRRVRGFEEVIRIELGDILWYLASLASRSVSRFGDVAVANLTKTRTRWLPTRPSTHLIRRRPTPPSATSPAIRRGVHQLRQNIPHEVPDDDRGRSANFEEGLRVANNTEYGLTGSIYTRQSRTSEPCAP